MHYGYLSLIPIIICFLLIFIKRNAYIAIAGGIISALAIILTKEYTFVLFETITEVFSSSYTVKTIVFIIIVGALINAMDKSGGVNGLILFLEKRNVKTDSKVGVQLFTMLIGMLMFVDATSSMAITAVVGKPLFQNAEIKTEKLALITNSTASPIAWIIPFGGAGAMMTGLLMQFDGINQNAFDYVLKAVPFQFYTISLLAFLIISIVFKFDVGEIRKIEFAENNTKQQSSDSKNTKARNMVVPICTLLMGIVVVLYITGKGNLLKGDGASAVFYSGLITLAITFFFYIIPKTATAEQCVSWFFGGIKTMFAVTMLLVFAFIFSDLLSKVGTANYLIGIFEVVPIDFLPLITFVLSAIIAFSTGTSSGTVAIMTSLLLPMVILESGSIPLVLGAIVSGAVFGDQNSIISDSVILTSSVTGIDTVTHVKTQMPYTLIAFGVSALLYLLFGFIN